MIQVVRKAFAVLECFRTADGSLSYKEICARLDLPRTTVHRLLTDLAEQGYVTQDPETGEYALGIKLFEIGMRAVVNTSFGLLGLLDVAEEAGLERFTTEDFGQTLGYWGIKTGPYIVLPLLGPSNLRETAALAADIKDSAASVLWHEPRDRNAATVLQLLDTRVRLLNAGRVLDEIALDKYVLLRDAYLARRRSLVYDGDPPEDDTAPPPFRGQAR